MIFRVNFKTPDVLDYPLEGMSDEEQIQAEKVAEKFIEYGEEITIEFDTETQTDTVVPIGV